MRLKFTFLAALLAVISLIGCSEDRAVDATKSDEYPVIASFAASELMLTDAAEFLSKVSGWSVEIDPEVRKINDLSFDLRNHTNQRLDAILNSIVAYLNGKHSSGFDWKRVPGEERVVIFLPK